MRSAQIQIHFSNLIVNVLRVGVHLKIAEELPRREQVVAADDHFPLLVRVGDLVGASHLRIGDAADDEYDQSGTTAHGWLAHISVPSRTSALKKKSKNELITQAKQIDRKK